MNQSEKETQNQLDKAIRLLRSVLFDSTIENEFDSDIYDFLEEYNLLEEGEEFYGNN